MIEMAFFSKQKKQETVKEVAKQLRKYPVIALANIASLPSKQFNAIKNKVRGKVKLVFTRQTLLKRAIEESGRKELIPLVDKFDNGSVLLLTDLNAFQLYSLLKQNKSKTFAKAGAIAPIDLVIPAGETNLAPGPVLTELKQVKIDARIQGPKVVIAKDATVAKKGTAISDAVAKILIKLGIEPMEIGIAVNDVYESGMIYDGPGLDVDEAQLKLDIAAAHQSAINLGVFAQIYNEVTAPLIIAKAEREAIALQKALPAEQLATLKS